MERHRSRTIILSSRGLYTLGGFPLRLGRGGGTLRASWGRRKKGGNGFLSSREGKYPQLYLIRGKGGRLTGREKRCHGSGKEEGSGKKTCPSHNSNKTFSISLGGGKSFISCFPSKTKKGGAEVLDGSLPKKKRSTYFFFLKESACYHLFQKKREKTSSRVGREGRKRIKRRRIYKTRASRGRKRTGILPTCIRKTPPSYRLESRGERPSSSNHKGKKEKAKAIKERELEKGKDRGRSFILLRGGGEPNDPGEGGGEGKEPKKSELRKERSFIHIFEKVFSFLKGKKSSSASEKEKVQPREEKRSG